MYYIEKPTKSIVEKSKILRADRNILLRLVTAYKVGREVNISLIMKHELLPVPIAIFETNGSIKEGNKAGLSDELINCEITWQVCFNCRWSGIGAKFENKGY
jgi:hypothetical protein